MEAVEQLSLYRHLITLHDGQRVCLRPLMPKDRDALVALFNTLPAAELCYFRNNVTDAKVVAGWAEHVDFSRVFPLVAVVGDRIVGNSTLHMGSGYTRHRAEVRIFLAKEFRRQGIGTAMLKAQIELAHKLGLRHLVAEIVESQPQVIHAFERLGFQRQCVFRDQFMTPDGETLDMVVLVHFLTKSVDHF
jgi:RimJ/RimL family protein N-acetyltransferase